MIEQILACALLQSPLAISGNANGLWYVGDINPSSAIFSGVEKDFDYELCERFSKDRYVVLRQFSRRPLALAVGNQNLWFIDNHEGVGLYKLNLPNLQRGSTSKNAYLQTSKMEALFETTETPTDFLIFRDKPLLVFGKPLDGTTELFHYLERQWVNLTPIKGRNVHVAQMQDKLIAAIPNERGATVWYMQECNWLGGDQIDFQGELIDLFCRDDWPILVTSNVNIATLSGIQKDGLVTLASFEIPKGRWGVSTSPDGISVVGVQRKGETTILDIGWPSGSTSKPIILEERFPEDDTLVSTVLFVSMVIVSLILLTKIGRSSQKPAKL
jgi:hypothetical protein